MGFISHTHNLDYHIYPSCVNGYQAFELQGPKDFFFFLFFFFHEKFFLLLRGNSYLTNLIHAFSMYIFDIRDILAYIWWGLRLWHYEVQKFLPLQLHVAGETFYLIAALLRLYLELQQGKQDHPQWRWARRLAHCRSKLW